ncbi:hypothetical protein FRC10_003021 [Ceratobasidium sp. 414]|nr:hypothetical protein FRC10_003021 [Ceratobasidium sp. 414]
MPAEDTEPTPCQGDRSRTCTQCAVDNAKTLAVVEEEEEESDNVPPPPPLDKPSKSTKSSDKGMQRVSPSPQSQNNRSGVISIADIVRAQPSTKVGRTTPPAELWASDDEADGKTSANSVQPSSDESGNDAGESRAWLAPTKSPAWSTSTKSVRARLSPKVGRMVPLAKLLTSEDEDDDGKAIGIKPSDNAAGKS